MSFVEVNKLRKAGRLKEAFEMASSDLKVEPNGIWEKRAMAWVLYAFAKDNSTFEHKDSFLKCLRQINSYAFGSDETIFWENVCLLVRGMIATCVRNNYNKDEYYDLLFAEIKHMPFPKQCDAYSSLLQNALRIKLTWCHFDAFCRWWDFDNFTENDFLPREINGKIILPLAERAIMAYSKALLQNQGLDYIKEWIPTLDYYIQQHHNYLYLPYYKAKLLIKCGESAAVTDELKHFVSKKKTEFWVWDLLGDASPREEDRTMYYCKAMTCHAKEEMTLLLREKIASRFISQKERGLARAELNNIITIRKRNKWSITPELYGLLEQVKDIKPATESELASYYKTHSAKAEASLLGIRQFEGKVRKSSSGFAFVSDVFVPSSMAVHLRDGEVAYGEAVKSYDQKKSKWGWKAVHVSHKPDRKKRQ